jgi:hypothetical protein
VWAPVIFITVVLGVTLFFNYQIITEFSGLREGLTSEVQKFEDDPTEATVPHDRALNFLKSELLPLAWIPIFAFFLVPWRQGRRVTLPEWLCAILPLLVILILTFSSRSSARYMLPVAMMTPFFIGAGAPARAALRIDHGCDGGVSGVELRSLLGHPARHPE